MPRLSVIMAVVPIAVMLIITALPASFTDPYAWIDAASLNTPAANGRTRRWYNMGHWEVGISPVHPIDY
jgi:hypothetical protein